MARWPEAYRDIIEELFTVITETESREACEDFFQDLCTVREIVSFAQRYQVAKLLSEGKTYDAIHGETTVSSATITRVNTSLNYGTGGYRAAIEKQKQKEAE